jgi:TetR/AcrR family transcriptional repressor of nem operon
MRYDAEHKQKTRERVLKEAAKAIRAEGAQQIGVAAVMAKAGLTHGGFYAHFKSKDELVTAAIDQMFDQGRARSLLVNAEPDPVKALNDYIDFYLSVAHRDTRGWGCPLPVLSADAPRLPEASRDRFATGVANLTKLLADQMTLLGRADPEMDASSMLSELMGALSLARADTDPNRSLAILDHSKAALRRRFGLETAQ